MSLISRNSDPFTIIDSFFNDRWLFNSHQHSTKGFSLDMVEKNDSFLVNADLPGMKKEDINVSTRDGFLTIGAEKKSEHTDNTDSYHYSDRSFGSFKRSVRLPRYVDATQIQANYDNGVLTVSIPKAEEVRPRTITIN